MTSSATQQYDRSCVGASARSVGRIERLNLRDVWKHEARDFTRWLADNLDTVAEATGLELTLLEREATAGDFSVDLLGQDASGRHVVIENQLERSDHDHLGKLLTYLAAFEASAAVWIVADPRVEHTRAVGWLNDSSSAEFYLLKAEAIRIEGSPPALLLTLITGPSQETKAIAREKQDNSEQQDRRKEFWAALLERIGRKGMRLHANLSPSTSEWLSTSVGISGLTWCYRQPKHGWQVEFYIDRGSKDKEWNKAAYDWLKLRRETIDAAFGPGLQWERRDPYQSARITHAGPGDWRDPVEGWERTHDQMIEAMQRLVQSIEPHLSELEAEVQTNTGLG